MAKGGSFEDWASSPIVGFDPATNPIVLPPGNSIVPDPTPAAAPAPDPNPRYQELTAPGGPSLFNNRMDTQAGREREAQMRAAEAALIVSQSHASRGELVEANRAIDVANDRLSELNRIGSGPSPVGFNTGFTQAKIDTFGPTMRPAAPPSKTDPGPGADPGGGPRDGATPGSFFSSPVASTPPPPPPPVKDPGRDVISFARNDLSPTGITNLLLEAIGGVEASTIARRDTVEGQNPYYDAISNVATIRKEYDATKLVSKQTSNESIFDIYAIDLNSKIPGDLYLRQRNLENFFYIADNGDLVIEFDNIIGDEQLQLEIAGGGTIKMVSES
jgi:hypothetical protein